MIPTPPRGSGQAPGRRRVYLTDWSIPLGVAAVLIVAWFLGWRVGLLVVLAGVLAGAAVVIAAGMRGERLRDTTMDVAGRPLLIHLYSPY